MIKYNQQKTKDFIHYLGCEVDAHGYIVHGDFFKQKEFSDEDVKRIESAKSVFPYMPKFVDVINRTIKMIYLDGDCNDLYFEGIYDEIERQNPDLSKQQISKKYQKEILFLDVIEPYREDM